MKAVSGAIRNVAGAPFRALARLIGFDKDLEFVEFAAAEDEIAPPAREKLEQLARALVERPELSLEVQGVFDPEIDAAAIRERKLGALVAERIASLRERAGTEPASASKLRRNALEELFRERFQQQRIDEVVAGHTAPAEPPAEPMFDLAGYLDALGNRLLVAQDVSETELTGLADARATAIGTFFETDGTVAAERIHTTPSRSIRKKDAGDGWVRLRLVARAD